MSLNFRPVLILGLLISACTSQDQPEPSSNALLKVLGPKETGITFSNNVTESAEFNYFTYTYAYHGGGVAVGDVNNDGLPDLYFTANQLSNKLYLNKGDLKFEDITETAGVAGRDGWTTGCTMVDINCDGWLDIYVCMSGMDADPNTRRNLLYINQKDGTFKEQAAAFGLDDPSHSTMAYFAELDGKPGLDLYLVNHRVDWSNNRFVVIDPKMEIGPYESDRFYVYNDGVYKEVTEESGMLNKAWGLSASIGDFNNDGWNDVYVANDFLEPDFLYINQQNGTFKEQNTEFTKHISFFGMGSDMADFNNDLHPDLCVLDMTPADHKRSKQNMASMRPETFFKMVEVGWHHQYMTNTLQLNNGNGTFSEIAHLAGIDRTDWSWAPLFADLDNDGWKDLFVTNGIKRDVTNNDFKMRVDSLIAQKGSKLDFAEVMNMIPTHVSENIFYRNSTDLGFEMVNSEWNVHHKATSTGAAYADLDLDGDLDLITNNLDAPASIIQNLSADAGDQNYIQFKLEGDSLNPFGVGAKVKVESESGAQIQELMPARGFQSSVEPILHFGIGADSVTKVQIEWPDGRMWESDLKANNRHTLSHEKAFTDDGSDTIHVLFNESDLLRHEHVENDYNDFAKEVLLPHRQSEHGPAMAVADVNGDGLDDVFFGASLNDSPTLFIQSSTGKFSEVNSQPWTKFKASEEIGAHFFDADNDGDPDLYVAAGSTEKFLADPAYRDQLYLNNGSGKFTHAVGALPKMLRSSQVVRSADIDEDGDLDLFVGGRNVPGAYPKTPNSFILINENGVFSDHTRSWNKAIAFLGMVTDAEFADLDGDSLQDLVVCGEWIPIRFFRNTGDMLTEVTNDWGDPSKLGWWSSLEVSDLDQDGDLDVIAGNLGLNNKFRPSPENPLQVFMSDFDQSASNDIVLAKSSGNTLVPVRGRECSSNQIPSIKQRFPTFKDFAEADVRSIYGSDKIDAAFNLQATEFASMILKNENGKFEYLPLPRAVQVSPINGIEVLDINNDGHSDLVVAGNLYGTEVETTRYDASIGMALMGDGHLNFKPIPAYRSGISINYNCKALSQIRLASGKGIIAANNNGPVQIFKLNDQSTSTTLP